MSSISVSGRTLELGSLGRDKERTQGNQGRVVLGVAIALVTLGVIYVPYLLELLWS